MEGGYTAGHKHARPAVEKILVEWKQPWAIRISCGHGLCLEPSSPVHVTAIQHPQSGPALGTKFGLCLDILGFALHRKPI